MDVKVLENKKEFACVSYIVDDMMIDAGVFPDIPIKKLVLTHSHFDHVMYANLIKKEYGAKIYATKECKDNLKKEEVVNPFSFSKTPKVEVDIIIKEGDKINGFEVMETPGHTNDSICLFNQKENILFSGDTLFKEGYGRTDLPTGNESLLMESLERIRKINPLHVFPGH